MTHGRVMAGTSPIGTTVSRPDHAQKYIQPQMHTDDIGSTNARFAALRMAPDYICVHQCASVVEIACLAVRMPAYPERYVSAHGACPGHSSQHSAGGDGHDVYRSPSPGPGITRFSNRRIVGGHRICDNAPTYSSARAFPRTAAMLANHRIMAVRQCRYAAWSAYTFAFYQAHGLSIGEQYSEQHTRRAGRMYG